MRRVFVFVLITIFATTSLAESLREEIERHFSEELQDSSVLVAQNETGASRTPQSKRRRSSSKHLKRALQLARQGDYVAASKLLYSLSRSPRHRRHRVRIKYILGLMLMEMKFHQVAAFQLVSVVKRGRGKYVRQSLEKLSLAADALNDDTMLKYAISKVKVSRFPKQHRDMLYFRLGEFRMQRKEFKLAADNFARVEKGSSFFERAKYNQGLALAEMGRLDESLAAFDDLVFEKKDEPKNDPARVAALIGKARVFYQKKEWDNSINTYRDIPRDTSHWHDALFESSWAMLRSAKFRTALSNFHSLHSPFYDDFYIPESLLLRGMVYLYICQYDEMEKVIGLFEKTYHPVRKQVNSFLRTHRNPMDYYSEIEKIRENYSVLASDNEARSSYQIPFLVARKIIQEGDYQRLYRYLDKLRAEYALYEKQSDSWKKASVGRYAKKIMLTRVKNTQKMLGKIIRNHLVAVRKDLRDLFEQNGFLRFEMFNGKKEFAKQEVAGKSVAKEQVDQNTERDYFVQNGYEYWPFKGEYWLDELGNYHYVGVQSCGR